MIVRNIFLIIVFAAALAFTYNGFSPNGLTLVRVPAATVATSDSALFGTQGIPTIPLTHGIQDSVVDTLTHQKVPVIAPVQAKAKTNRDSVKKAVAAATAEKKKDSTKYSVITLDQLQRLMKAKRGMLIDARNAEDFVKSHIPGATNIPYMEMDKYFDMMAQIPSDTLIIVYCNGPECHLGRGLCDFMSQMDFKKVYLYDDGWDGWQAAKLPEEKSPEGK